MRKILLVWTIALVLASCAGSNSGPELENLSTGLYRIPYEDNARVWITNDHRSHSPVNRIDMTGSYGKRRIVAAADGTVRYVVDEFSIRQQVGTVCNNNYVWIEHANGEWTKYTHMRQHSTRVRAKIAVGDKIKAGTYLGDEGDVGCASGDHLHFEVAVPFDLANPIRPQGGFVIGTNRIPRICGIPGQIFVRNTSYTAAACTGV